jgi:hypothetical protein
MKMLTALKLKTMELSRKKKLAHFNSLYSIGQTVLDVGVSSEFKKKGHLLRKNNTKSTMNYFLKNFGENSKEYTGLGIQNMVGMAEMYPGKNFVQYSGGIFPFKDNQFDWSFSNAVIEHVGNRTKQLFFLNEMLRVSRSVFFTTPNKHFIIETHTSALMIHWFDSLYSNWYRKRNNDAENNINLFSYNQLKDLLLYSDASNYQIVKNNFFGFCATFTCICSKKQEILPLRYAENHMPLHVDERAPMASRHSL